jgi:hypothetical protein
MSDLNRTLCERLRAIECCPVCGAARKEFDTHDRIAIAVFACGADVVAIGGSFVVALGCKTTTADALALIKAEEEAKLEQVADAH